MLKFISLAAMLLAAAGAPANAQQKVQPAPVAAQPAEAANLALANQVAAALWPDGTYGRMAKTMIGGEGGLSDLVLDMRPDDIIAAFMEGMAAAKDDKAAKSAPPPPKDAKPSRTLREQLTAEDPNFDERMRITVKVASEEIARIAQPLEPKMREGIAKSVARRFDKPQLEQIAA